MLEVLVFALLAGLDNLQVSASLAMLPLERRRVHMLAIAFYVSETGAAVLGLFLGRGIIDTLGPVLNPLLPFVTVFIGCTMLYLAWRRQTDDLLAIINKPAVLIGLPLSLSLDNMLAGAGISFSSYPVVSSALIIGLVSGSMACAGLYLGQAVRRFLPERIELAAGVYLCFLGVRTMMTDVS